MKEIKITEEFQIPGTDIVLEEGDSFKLIEGTTWDEIKGVNQFGVKLKSAYTGNPIGVYHKSLLVVNNKTGKASFITLITDKDVETEDETIFRASQVQDGEYSIVNNLPQVMNAFTRSTGTRIQKPFPGKEIQ